ncbi:MAG TPA: hypothetical protein VGC42_29565 [Kofleriaceae bacterium]
MRCLLLAFVCVLAACPGGAGGSYVQAGRQGGDADHGETNGRRFDFVSNMPDKNDDWQIRITGSSMWVSYAVEQKTDKLGTFTMTDKETAKVWRLIDALDIPSRKHGKRDEDEGYVSLQLKEGGDAGEGADISAVYVSRASDDEDLISLAKYLQDLTLKYKGRKPKF